MQTITTFVQNDKFMHAWQEVIGQASFLAVTVPLLAASWSSPLQEKQTPTT